MKIEMDEWKFARTSGRSMIYGRKNFYRLGRPRFEEFEEFKEFRSSGVQEFRSSGVQEYGSCRSTGAQRF